jgi:hypothetical protein
MAHYTLIARINTGDGRFPFVNVQFDRPRRDIHVQAFMRTLVVENLAPTHRELFNEEINSS